MLRSVTIAGLGLALLASACAGGNSDGTGGSGNGGGAGSGAAAGTGAAGDNGGTAGQTGGGAAGGASGGDSGGSSGSAGNSGSSGSSGSGGLTGSGGVTAGTGGSATGGTGGTSSARGGSQGTAGRGGTGGTSGSGGTAAPANALVTSAANAFWKTGTWTESTANATVTVNDANAYQTWEGFGGAFNELGWSYLTTQAMKDQAIQLLFGKDGCHFAWGRIPMGSSDYATDRYSLNETAGDTAMTNFSIERDKHEAHPLHQGRAGGEARTFASGRARGRRRPG